MSLCFNVRFVIDCTWYTQGDSASPNNSLSLISYHLIVPRLHIFFNIRLIPRVEFPIRPGVSSLREMFFLHALRALEGVLATRYWQPGRVPAAEISIEGLATYVKSTIPIRERIVTRRATCKHHAHILD